MNVLVVALAVGLSQATQTTDAPNAKPVEAKPVVKEIAKPCFLIASAHAAALCAKAKRKEADNQLSTAKSRKKDLDLVRTLERSRQEACGEATVLRLAVGVTVEVSANPDICADSDPDAPKGLVKIRLTGGKDAGTVGCLAPDKLRDPIP